MNGALHYPVKFPTPKGKYWHSITWLPKVVHAAPAAANKYKSHIYE